LPATYGAPRTTEASTLPTDYTFTGQKLDADAGLMYYGARYYDATLGRFISADTLVPNAANPQALNRYAYVLNNPLRYTDPTGHVPCGSGSGLQWEDCPVPDDGGGRTGGGTPQIEPLTSLEKVFPSPVPAPTPRVTFYPPSPTSTPSYSPAQTPTVTPAPTPGTPNGTPPAVPYPTLEPAQQLQVVVPREAMRYLRPSSLENGRWDWIWPGVRSGGGTAGDR